MKTFTHVVFIILATTVLVACSITQTRSSEPLSGCWKIVHGNHFAFDSIQFDSNTFSYRKLNSRNLYIGRYDVEGDRVRLEIDYDIHQYQFALHDDLLTLTEHENTITLRPCKSSRPYQSIIMNGDGLTIDIPKVQLDIEIDGTTVITSVTHDITTSESWDTEAFIYFPLPDNARVLEYAIDIEGQLVPGVAVKKEEARNAFETIQSNGIDPGIAEVRQGNIFSTEIYPLSSDTPRKMHLKYIETLEKDLHGQYRYRFPLSKYLNSTEFKFSIHGRNISKRSKLVSNPSRYLSRITPHTWSGKNTPHQNKNIKLFKDLEIAIKPQFSEDISIYKNPNNELHASLKHHLTPKDLDNIHFESLDILWDASTSMELMHDKNINVIKSLLKHLLKKENTINLNITVFASDILQQKQFLSSDNVSIISFLNSIQYDGGTRFSIIGDLESDAALLFSDGINSIASLTEIKSNNPIYIFPHSDTRNLPYLSEIARNTNGFIFDPHKVSPKNIPQFIGKKAPSIRIEDHTYGKHYFYQNTVLNNHVVTDINIHIQPNRKDNSIYINQKHVNSPWPLPANPSTIGAQRFIESKLFYLLSNPQNHRAEITNFGLQANTVTPYTTLIVFEDIDDYLTYGVTPPYRHPNIADYYKQLEQHKKLSAKEDSEQKKEFWENIQHVWSDRIDWWQNGAPKKHPNSIPELEEIIVTAQKREAPNYQKIQISPKQQDPTHILSARQTIRTNVDITYQAYLDLKNKNLRSPAYYIEWARLFYQHGHKVIARRILTNLVEMDNENVYFERVIAYLMREFEDELLAINILEHVRDLRPYQPNSYRDLANTWETLGKKGTEESYIERALRNYEYTAFDDWLGTGWGDEEIRAVAIEELLHLHHQYPEQTVNLPKVGEDLIQNMDKDVRVVISWNSRMADIDLHIQEPSGDEVSYRRRYGRSGGHLTYDDIDGFGPEEYLNRKAQKGEYKIYANLYASNAIEMYGPITVTVDIYLNYGRKNEIHKTTTIQLKDNDNRNETQKIYIGKFEV